MCPLGKGGCNEKCNCCSLPYYGSCHGDRWGRIQGEEIAEGLVTIIPKDTTFGNFRGLFTEKDFLLWVWNSLIIAFTTAIIGIIIARVSACAFSRWKFPGRNAGMVFLLFTQMIPVAMIDGMSPMGTFYRIMLPLTASALAIAFLFNFMNAWNDYMLVMNREREGALK